MQKINNKKLIEINEEDINDEHEHDHHIFMVMKLLSLSFNSASFNCY